MMADGDVLDVSWTVEQEARYRWLLDHIETCRTCDLCREDNSSVECDQLAAYWQSDPEPRAVAEVLP